MENNHDATDEFIFFSWNCFRLDKDLILGAVNDFYGDWDCLALQEWRVGGSQSEPLSARTHRATIYTQDTSSVNKADCSTLHGGLSRELKVKLKELPAMDHTKRVAVAVHDKWQRSVKGYFLHPKLVVVTLLVGSLVLNVVSAHLIGNEEVVEFESHSQPFLTVLTMWMAETPNEGWLVGMDANGTVGELNEDQVLRLRSLMFEETVPDVVATRGARDTRGALLCGWLDATRASAVTMLDNSGTHRDLVSHQLTTKDHIAVRPPANNWGMK